MKGDCMERVIKLLEERNRHLEKFYLLNAQEIDRLDGGDFDHVDDFYKTRENLLEMVMRIEKMVDEQIQCDSESTPITEEMRTNVQRSLTVRDRLVKEILHQDLEILTRIDRQKTEIIRELQAIQKGRRAVGAYHSGSAARSLDEEI